MIKREQIIQSIYGVLENLVSNDCILFRNKEFDYEMETEKLIILNDGESEVIDTVYSPKIDTIEQTIEIEIYLNKEYTNAQENQYNMDLAVFEDAVRTALQSFDISTTDIMQLTLTPSQTISLDPENGQLMKMSSFNVLVVFDDK